MGGLKLACAVLYKQCTERIWNVLDKLSQWVNLTFNWWMINNSPYLESVSFKPALLFVSTHLQYSGCVANRACLVLAKLPWTENIWIHIYIYIVLYVHIFVYRDMFIPSIIDPISMATSQIYPFSVVFLHLYRFAFCWFNSHLQMSGAKSGANGQ